MSNTHTKHEKKHEKSELGIRVVIRYLRARLKAASRHIPFLLGLASSLLLAVALGQFSGIDSLTRTTKFAELEEFGDTVALGCALGETKHKKRNSARKVRIKHTAVRLLLRYWPAFVHRSRRVRVKVRGCGVGVLCVS